MNKYTILGIVAITTLLFSCENVERKTLSGKDSSEILNVVLAGENFKKETLRNSDTLYILKVKKFNSSWPIQTPFFHIKYINDAADAKIVNMGPKFPYDRRTRISVPIFELKKDTVFVSLVDVGYEVHYDYKLLFQNKKWEVVEEGGGMR